jgi:hypothetical protein
MGKFVAVGFAAVLLACGAFGQKPQPKAGSCERLAQLTLPEAKIVSAQIVAAGAFTAPPGETPRLAGQASFYKTLPAFCRMEAVTTPSTDSDIKIEVWMPTSGWNGKLQGQGNGGFAGEIDHHQMGMAIGEGYATVGTDTGHAGSAIDATWALGHPEKVKDFAYRGIHEMTAIAKAAIKAFYGNAPRRSYFGGCSNGGRQALMEAQRFPEDYDGILAGAPANFWTHLLTSAVWDAQVTTLDPASYIPSSKVPAIARAVNEACDAHDGVSDGVVNDPRQCRFDPAAMLCKEGDSDKCLTAEQVTTLKKLYQGAQDSHGRKIFPGFLPGAEDGGGGWALWITGPAPGQSLLFSFGVGYFSNMVYDKADWDYKTANLDQATAAADDQTAPIFNATDANLKAFKDRGGKLILYHGWNDPAISALNTIDYYNSVASTMGSEAAGSFVRVFMVSGMQHCADGPGPDAFGQPGVNSVNDARKNIRLALEKWVEKRTAPSAIIATKYVSDDPSKGVKMTRPLCAYPQTAKYKGSGDPNDAVNFVCAPGGN